MKHINYIYYLFLIVFTLGIASFGVLEVYRVYVEATYEDTTVGPSEKVSKLMDISKKSANTFKILNQYKMDYLMPAIFFLFLLFNWKFADPITLKNFHLMSLGAALVMVISNALYHFLASNKDVFLGDIPFYLSRRYLFILAIAGLVYAIMNQRKVNHLTKAD